MQRISRLSVLCLIAGAAMSACKPEEVTNVPRTPSAGVRFINALPDSAGAFGLDFRFVDLVENSTQFRVPFRNSPTVTGGVTASSSVQFKAAAAGPARHFVVFLDDTIQAIASTKLKDSTLNLEDGKNYTVILWGAARAGQMKLKVIEETIADPGPGKVWLRVINAGDVAIDASQYVTGTAVPGTPTWAAVAPYTASAFVAADTGSKTYNVRLAGTTTSLLASDLLALLGAPATSTAGCPPAPATCKLDIASLPGTRIAGSAITLVVYPRSTAGARTPQTATFLVPAGAFIWDRRPPIGF